METRRRLLLIDVVFWTGLTVAIVGASLMVIAALRVDDSSLFLPGVLVAIGGFTVAAIAIAISLWANNPWD